MTRALVLMLLVAVPVAAQALEPPPLIAPPVMPVAPLEPVVRLRWKPHLMLGVGAVFHQLYGIPYGTGSMFLRGGGDYGHFGIYAEVMGEGGAAQPRLTLGHWRVGVLVQYINDRFRVGTGIRVGELFVQRATSSELDNGGVISLYALGSVDVARWRGHALWLGLEVGFDVVLFPENGAGDAGSDISPSASLQLGFRL